MISALLVALIVVATLHRLRRRQPNLGRPAPPQPGGGAGGPVAGAAAVRSRQRARGARMHAPHLHADVERDELHDHRRRRNSSTTKRRRLDLHGTERSQQTEHQLPADHLDHQLAALSASRPKVEQSSIITPANRIGPGGRRDQRRLARGRRLGRERERRIHRRRIRAPHDRRRDDRQPRMRRVRRDPRDRRDPDHQTPRSATSPPPATFKIPAEQVTLAPNLTTHEEYIVNRGGRRHQGRIRLRRQNLNLRRQTRQGRNVRRVQPKLTAPDSSSEAAPTTTKRAGKNATRRSAGT